MFPWPRIGAPFGGCFLILACLVCAAAGIVFLTGSRKSRRKPAMRTMGILLLLTPVGMIASAAMGDRQIDTMFAAVDPGLVAGEWTYRTTRLSLKPDGTYHIDGNLAAFKVLTEPKPDGRWRLPLGGNILTLTGGSSDEPVEAFVFWYGDQPAIFPFRSEADLDPDVFPPSRFFLKSSPKP